MICPDCGKEHVFDEEAATKLAIAFEACITPEHSPETLAHALMMLTTAVIANVVDEGDEVAFLSDQAADILSRVAAARLLVMAVASEEMGTPQGSA